MYETNMEATQERAPQEHSLASIYEELVSLYGPMMELGDLAMVLKRNRNSIRNAIASAEKKVAANQSCNEVSNEGGWAYQLSLCKTRIGKKILFRTRVVADLIDAGRFS